MSEPDLEPAAPRSTLDFPVVGVGASAGGLKALLGLFGAVRPDSGMAFVVILHLSPEHESHIAELLQKVTPIPIVVVKNAVSIEKDRIYVISPRSHLVMLDGHLQPVAQTPRQGGPLTIDRFFETLAEAHGQCAFGIVLSGTGSDGTRGAKSVKAHGGVLLVQVPAEAEYDSMPESAIASGAADFVLPVRDMPAKLASLWDSAAMIRLPAIPPAQDVPADAEDALREVLSLTKARTSHDFSQYKRPTLLRRIERRLQVTQLRDLPSYRDFVREHPSESRSLLRDFLISVTSFFRDEQTFEALRKTVIPELFAQAPEQASLRLWVVGCATGEEVYSLAMLLAEHAADVETPIAYSLFATDIDEQALAFARAGLYPESIRDQVSAERLERFFAKESVGYRVQKTLRDRVMFATHNVIQDPPFSRLDLVACRNLLIYLDREAQRRVLDLLHFSLRPDGYLLLGRSEMVEECDGFAAIDTTNRIFQQRPRSRKEFNFAAQPPPIKLPVGNSALPGGRRMAYGDLHHRLLEHYGPPSVVVDDRYEVVHLSDTAGRYLQFGPGEPSVNLLNVVQDELRFELRSALDQALQSMRTVERRYVPVRRGPDVSHVDVKVHPVRDRLASRTFALVLFEEVTGGLGAPAIEVEPAGGDQAARSFEDRLHAAEARLRALTEEHAVQAEEAQAANEELQATNEELRATSEELETGKEELQSINEELTTVNQELRNKIEEARRIGDDLTNFMHATRIPVLFVDLKLRLMRFTPAAQQIFNVIDTDIGRSLLDITHRLNDTGLNDDIRKAIGTLAIIEREVPATDGRFYTLHVLPYRASDDRIGGAVLTFFDVTDRKMSEEAVRTNEVWLRLVIDSIQDYAILRLDPDGRIVSWNPAARTIFGYTEAEAVGRPFSMLFSPEDRAAGVPESTLKTAREVGRAESERWKVRKDGTRFYASGVTAPLLDAGTYGYVKLLRDLTADEVARESREAMLAAERAARSAAEEANRVKEQFVATLSHELRNPLALVLMQSELLLRAPEVREAPRLSNAAGIIHRMVRAQSQFVNDMLDVSRARTGKLAIDRQLVPLALLVADSIGAFRQEADANAITLEVEIASEPLFVEADAVRVRQIAWNLLSNALKFTPHGGRVTVRLLRDGEFARLDVEDNGQGIAPEFLPRIFEWFSQGESGPTRRQGGMGIGLALVKQLAELHGGRVEAHSEGVGKGARFTVSLPLQSALTPSFASPPPSAESPATGRLAGLRILVIDDLPDSAESMSQLLQIEGAIVAAETQARAAIKRAHTEKFDVIISDIAMPGMDGHAMLREIRANPLNAKTPAIAHSGYGGDDDTARSTAAGFQKHLTKPAGLEQLIEAIAAAR